MKLNIDDIIKKAKTSESIDLKEIELNDDVWEKVVELSHLKYIHITDVENVYLPNSISKLNNVDYLYIYSCNNVNINQYISGLKSLTFLNIHNCKSISIHKKIAELPKLNHVNITSCGLDRIPETIFDISILEALDLKWNKIKQIPEELFKLSNISYLNLSGNQISEIPIEISQLTKLKNIEISDNPLNSLQFGYLFTDEKRDFIFLFHNFQDKNLSLTYNDNLIFFQNKENHGFIRFIDDIHEFEMHKFFIHKYYPKYHNCGGFIIYVFGDNEKQLEVLSTLRKHIEGWIEKNEIQYISLSSKQNEEKSKKSSCMRFFYYRSNLRSKEIKGSEFIIDFEKLLEHKSLEKNTYFDDEHGREIPIDDLLKYIGAEKEKRKSVWNGTHFITKVEIENFKIFSNLSSDLSKHINILIGRNGLGKTSFLQALTLGLLPLSNVDKSNELEKYISFNSNKSDITIRWGDEYRRVFVFKNELKHENYLDFPQKLILSYGVNLNTEEKLSHTEIVEQLIIGNALPYSTKSIFKDYSTDFYDPIILLERLFIEKKGNGSILIDSIIQLIKTTLNDFLNLFSFPEKITLHGDFADYYFLDLNNNKLKTNNLSEGYKDFILQITDIILRIIASRNSIFGSKKVDISVNILKKVNGIIIIDEFDRHLHPQLQRKLLDKLKEYFENIQFILSTHNIFSLQSAEGYTALIINTEDNKLKITSKEISKGLSLESIFNLYFNGNDTFFGYQTELLLEKFKSYINKQRKHDLTTKEKKEFKEITNNLLNYGERIKGIVTREIRQLERLTDKSVEI